MRRDLVIKLQGVKLDKKGITGTQPYLIVCRCPFGSDACLVFVLRHGPSC